MLNKINQVNKFSNFEFETLSDAPTPAYFENGVILSPIIADYYSNISPEIRQQWSSIADVKFYDWLKEPSEEDPLYGQTDLPISRLAAYIHSLQFYSYIEDRKLLDVYGQDRLAFLDWFSGLGNWSFQLDESFLAATRQQVAACYSQLRYQAYGNQAQPNPENLKILILSAPRTGNNWLLTILAHLYALPTPEIPYNSSPNLTEQRYIARFGIDLQALENLGPRWVAYHHMYLNYALVEWAASQGIILLTTIRHPADTLVSLYHFVNNYQQHLTADPFLHELLVEKFAPDAASRYHFQEKARLKNYVRWHYYEQLAISHDWLLSGASQPVRYEDLQYNPVPVLQSLTEKILPASKAALERALLLSDFKLVRSLAAADQKFYRRGEVGSWHDELPSDVVEFMQTDARYQLIFQRLGYSLETLELTRPSLFVNPLAKLQRFDNGIALQPILIKCFLLVWSPLTNQKPEKISQTGPNSFFVWLNEPADKAKAALANHDQPDSISYITNLAAFVYKERGDVQAAFWDIYGQHQADFLNWFVTNGLAEYELDPIFGLSENNKIALSA